MWIGSLGLEDSLEEDLATHFQYSWPENHMEKEPGRVQSTGSQRVGPMWLSMYTRSLKFCLCLWWDPHLSFLGSLWSCPKADSQSFLLSTNADGTCYTPASVVGSYDKVSQVEGSLYRYIYWSLWNIKFHLTYFLALQHISVSFEIPSSKLVLEWRLLHQLPKDLVVSVLDIFTVTW